MSLISGQASRSMRSGFGGSKAPAAAGGKTYAEKK